MTKKHPDPSYWGNPPQTPTRKSREQPRDKIPRESCQTNAYQPQEPSPQYHHQEQNEPRNPFPDQSRCTSSRSSSSPRRGCIIAALIAIVLIFILGLATCTAVVGLSSYIPYNQEHQGQILIPERPSAPDDVQTTDIEANNESFRDAFDLSGSAPITQDELSSIKQEYFPDQTTDPDEKKTYQHGLYFIGNDIPADEYWFSGSDTDLSYFFILEPTSNNDAYNVVHINSYYGHNLMDLEEGQVLVLANNGTMQPTSSVATSFGSPYQSGMYRVGTDLPAGTYQLKLGPADDYSACYIMKDLNYQEDSYLFESYYIPGDKPDEITLEDGTYVELYNMAMTPQIT